jgi:uncharacterized CHY-type Zn-finger protein
MAEPSNKSPKMWRMIDEVSLSTFGRRTTDCIKADTCVMCGGPACKFKDELSIKEFSISGMCQECQDEVWKEM